MSSYSKDLDSSFTADKRYTVDITDGMARKLKKAGFNVYRFFQDEETLTAFYDRSEVYSEALLIMCKPGDEEAFLDSLSGEVLEESRKAVQNAIVNFSPAATRLTVLENFSEFPKLMKALAEEN